jgi:L-iditol 2-dehydrogenase
VKALVKTARGPGLVELIEVPEPDPGPGWVVVRVAACGICGTDLHILSDEHKYWPPVVLGHEYVGTIAELGSGVEGWAVGERVVCEQHTLACGHCHACRTGAIHLCAAKRSPGWGIDGAFAPYVALPASLLHRVPDNVTNRAAAVTEPTAICLTALDRLRLRAGETALVIGPGPVGLLSAMIARAAGAGRVVVAGRSSSAGRLDLAQRLGFETVLADSGGAASLLDRACLDGGADVVIEASGSAGGVDLSLRCARTLGGVVLVGLVGPRPVEIGFDDAMRRALTVYFSMSSEYSAWDRALTLMAVGRVDPGPLTAAYRLDDWRKAFADVESRAVVKALIAPNGLDELESEA